MSHYQCTDCGAVTKGSRYTLGADCYSGTCSECGASVYHLRLSKREWLAYRVLGRTPSLDAQREQAAAPHDPLYGWNDNASSIRS